MFASEVVLHCRRDCCLVLHGPGCKPTCQCGRGQGAATESVTGGTSRVRVAIMEIWELSQNIAPCLSVFARTWREAGWSPLSPHQFPRMRSHGEAGAEPGQRRNGPGPRPAHQRGRHEDGRKKPGPKGAPPSQAPPPRSSLCASVSYLSNRIVTVPIHVQSINTHVLFELLRMVPGTR